MGRKIKNLKFTEPTTETELQSIAGHIQMLLDPEINERLKYAPFKTADDFYLGGIINSFNKLCRKNNLSTEAELEKRILQLDFSKVKALGIMATRADTKKYPELLALESNRLVKLADYAGKGKKVSAYLIENGIDLKIDLDNQRETRGFIVEVDEFLGKLEKKDDEIDLGTVKDNAADVTVDVQNPSEANQKKGKQQVKFSTLYKRATTSALTCFNRIIADGTLLDGIEPDDFIAITEKLEKSFKLYKHTVERRDQTTR